MNKFIEFILIAMAFFVVTTIFMELDKRASQTCGYTEAFTRTSLEELYSLLD